MKKIVISDEAYEKLKEIKKDIERMYKYLNKKSKRYSMSEVVDVLYAGWQLRKYDKDKGRWKYDRED